ncbi:hypothetical protein, partial [Agathobaculum hominis]
PFDGFRQKNECRIQKKPPGDIVPSGGVKTRFHSDFSLVRAVTGAFRGAFDPDARQAHFAAPRTEPFQPGGSSLFAREKRLLFLRHRINNDYNVISISISAEKVNFNCAASRQYQR